ncbi:MAG: hypothetical protein HY868_24260 [Chloroflexi bacterium]|nr:hypothetical protein [Chloroflexota bacterium]
MPRKWIHWLVVSLFAGLLGAIIVSFDAPTLDAQSAQVGVRVLQSDTNRIVLELNVDAYSVRTQRVESGTFSVLAIPGLGHTIEPGKPQLPTQSAMIAIPPGAQVALTITADDARTDALANPPLPVPTQRVNADPRQSLPSYAGASYVPDAATYSTNRAYPASVARVATTGAWRSQRYVVVEFNLLQYNPVTRQATFHRRVRVELALSYPQGRTAQALGGAVNEGAFESVFQGSFANYASARNWRARPATTQPARAPRYSGGPWYKIAVNADGLYQVTCQDLQNAGVNPATLNTATLQLFDAATELAINVVGTTWTTTCGASNYFEFLGQAATSRYSITNIYWLTFGATNGKRMPTRDGSVAGVSPGVFTDTLHTEENHYYRSAIPYQDTDHWFWNFIASGAFADYPFQANRLAGGTYTGTATLRLVGSGGLPYTAQVLVNGNVISNVTWTHDLAYTATVPFSQAFMLAGNNTLRVQNNSAAGKFIVFNSFDVSYNATLTAVTDTLRFRQVASGTWQYPITSFTSNALQVFDITDPYSVTRFINTSITGGPSYTLTFGDTIASAREYLALANAQRKSPASITLDASANLVSPSNGADYIAISHNAFLTNVQPLVNLRAAQGLSTKLIDVQDVYDEFADGLADPQAIRDFLAYAFANWQAPAPAYVLLVGDGHTDPLGYCIIGSCPTEGATTPNRTFIPPYFKFVDPWIGETASDNRLVTFSPTNTLPSLAIGRLPVNNTTEADAMVNKIIANEQSPTFGGWRGTIAFLSDNTFSTSGAMDGAGDFWAYSDEVASSSQLMPFSFIADRIYYNPCDPNTYAYCALANPPYTPYTTTAALKSALNSSVNDGRLILNYVGHGSIMAWAHETFFAASDVAGLTNSGKPMVVLEMTCYTGYFHHNNQSFSSLAETNVRATSKGALASWAASGLGVATGHDYINRGFFLSIMSPGLHQIGPATVAGKQFLYTNGGGGALDLLDTFNLLGDPAARLAFQPNMFLPQISK